jgi:hypothetical protein
MECVTIRYWLFRACHIADIDSIYEDAVKATSRLLHLGGDNPAYFYCGHLANAPITLSAVRGKQRVLRQLKARKVGRDHPFGVE